MTGAYGDAKPILQQRARDLAPRIAAAADAIEQQRRLPEPLVQELADAGLFHMLAPAWLGGAETDLTTFALAVEQVAQADGSTGWCISQGAGSAFSAVRFEQAAATRIWGDPRGIVAWGPGSGTAVAVEGGYRVSGQWSFASGAHHATWLGGSATVAPADGASVGGAATGAGRTNEPRLFMFPAASAVITDTWHVSGLRGTGSDSFAVTDLFVPGDYTPRTPTAAQANTLGPLYVFSSTSVYAIGFASVALGIARGAVDAFVALASRKTARLDSAILRESAVTQTRMGHVEAELRAAHAFLHQSIAGAWHSACERRSLSLEERVLLRLATTHAIHTAAQVVNTVYYAAGSSAIFASNAFERRFRDVNAVTQQVQAAETHFATAGRFFLGMDPPRGML